MCYALWFYSQTTDTRGLNPWFFVAQIQISIPPKNLGFGYEGLVSCRNNSWLIKKNGQGTHSTKKGADKLAKNFLNAPKIICPNCCPKPKSLGFRWKKALLGVHSPWLYLSKRDSCIRSLYGWTLCKVKQAWSRACMDVKLFYAITNL